MARWRFSRLRRPGYGPHAAAEPAPAGLELNLLALDDFEPRAQTVPRERGDQLGRLGSTGRLDLDERGAVEWRRRG